MRTEPIFDTYSLVKRISKAGVAEDAAQEIVHAISESRNFDYNFLATKADIAEVKADITFLKQETEHIKETMATKADVALLKQDIAEVRTEIHQVKYEILKWMMPFLVTIIGLIVAGMVK